MQIQLDNEAWYDMYAMLLIAMARDGLNGRVGAGSSFGKAPKAKFVAAAKLEAMKV